MKFEPVAQKFYEGSLAEWGAGPYSIVELPFAFGQHRIQIWHFRVPDDPDVLPPNW